MFEQRTAWSLTALVIFITVIIVVSLHGRQNRILAPDTTVQRVDSPEKAFLIWKDKKARGRVLLLFDNYPHMRGLNDYKVAPQLTSSNLVEFSVFSNILRRIYFIVPDAAWNEFQHQEIMQPLRVVPGLDRGLYLYNINGLPLVAVPLSSLPPLTEKPIVFINTKVFNYAEVVALLSQKQISSDIIISYPDNAHD
jgi:hypothetical protein